MSSPFVVFDAKGGEVTHKDSKIGGANKWNDKTRGSYWNLKHTSRGGKLINLYVAFECALHMFACIAQVLKFNILACVVYARL